MDEQKRQLVLLALGSLTNEKVAASVKSESRLLSGISNIFFGPRTKKTETLLSKAKLVNSKAPLVNTEGVGANNFLSPSQAKTKAKLPSPQQRKNVTPFKIDANKPIMEGSGGLVAKVKKRKLKKQPLINPAYEKQPEGLIARAKKGLSSGAVSHGANTILGGAILGGAVLGGSSLANKMFTPPGGEYQGQPIMNSY